MSRHSTVIAIDGPAASGKSSTAANVARELGFLHVDSGAFYRRETARRLGVTDIRSEAVTAAVSGVAQIREVRAQVNAEIRQIAAERDIVVDGRDMGSVVFPDAQLKIFLVAAARERARRRLLQRLGREPRAAALNDEERQLKQRDASDASNMVRADDAVLLDTTNITQEEQVATIVLLARSVIARVR